MPVLHVVAGPNGAGKTTFCRHVLIQATRLPFVNADEIAKERWPGDEEAHGHDAAAAAEIERDRRLAAGTSFIAETVFSHPSKLELIRTAKARGYLVALHAVLVPEELSIARVGLRAQQGGHSVPIAKVRARYRRLWPFVHKAARMADEAVFYDNSRAAKPYREVARYRDGAAQYPPEWPDWFAFTPAT
jgi:predicted ABC-type ATPase